MTSDNQREGISMWDRDDNNPEHQSLHDFLTDGAQEDHRLTYDDGSQRVDLPRPEAEPERDAPLRPSIFRSAPAQQD